MKVTVNDILKNTPKDQLDNIGTSKAITVDLDKFQRMNLNNQMMTRALEKALENTTEIIFNIDGKTFGACIVEPEPNKKSIGFFQLIEDKNDGSQSE